jgi:PAS domain S-box-containing protein
MALSGIITDVTERKRTEQALADSERNFRSVLRRSPIVLSRINRELRYVWVYNPLLGDRPDSFTGRRMGEVVPSAGTQRMIEAVRRVFATGLAEQINIDIDLPDGRHYYDLWIEPDDEGSGQFETVTSIAIEVTRHHLLQKELAASEERYRLLVQAATATTWRIDGQTGRFIEPSPEWEVFTGQRWEDYSVGGFIDVVHPDDRARVTQDWQRAFTTGDRYETRCRIWHAPTQRYRHIEGHGVPLRDADGSIREWIGANFDVDERVSAVRSTQERTQEMEALLDILPVGVFIAHDATAQVITGNRMAYAMLNLAPGSNISLTPPPGQPKPPYKAVVDGREVAPVDLPIQSAGRLGVELLNVELEHRHRDGRVITYLGNVRPLFDADGHVRSVIAVFLDVSERKRLERSLAESQRRLQTAAAAGGMGMFVWNGGEYALWNQQACAYYGIESDAEETEVHLPAVYARLWPDRHFDFGRPLESYCDPDGLYRQELELPTADGRSRWVRLVGQIASAEAPLPARLIGVIYDITEAMLASLELKQAHEELEQRVRQRTRQLAMALAQLEREVDKSRQTQAQLAEIHRLLAQAQEGERMRLAHDLHDGPMQELATYAMELTLLARKANEEIKPTLLALRERLKETNLVLRNFAGDLRPPILDSFGLTAALQAVVEQMQERMPDLTIHAELQDVDGLLTEEAHLTLYRVLQQALANVQRHASARTVTVRLLCEPENLSAPTSGAVVDGKQAPGRVHLIVQDDGVGFDLPATWLSLAREGHLGIVGMAERMDGIGGCLNVDSRPGAGTTVEAIVPLKE